MTIVNQYPIMIERAPVWVIFLGGLSLAICSYIFFLGLADKSWGAAAIFGCFVALLCVLLLLGLRKRESGRNRYECLIDDTTSFVEVAKNYDIVGQRGDLWILEDKNK